MAAQVPREQTGAEIVVGADRIADDQADLLAAVELLDAFGLCRSNEQSAAKESCGSAGQRLSPAAA